MFYRVKENQLYDYAANKYADDCLETDIVTQVQLDEDKNLVIIENGVLVLNPDYPAEQLIKVKEAKKAENNTKRSEIDRIKADFSADVSGYLLTQTPVGDILTIVMGLAMPAMMTQSAIPEGAMRYYDENNVSFPTPEITASFVPTFYQNFTLNVKKIDTYSTLIEAQINACATIEEVEAMIINYDFENIEEYLMQATE